MLLETCLPHGFRFTHIWSLCPPRLPCLPSRSVALPACLHLLAQRNHSIVAPSSKVMVEHVGTPLASCPFCLGAPKLTSHPTSCHVWGLSYKSGFLSIRLQRKCCDVCSCTFLGCWAFAPAGQGRPRIACHPDLSPWFIFRERLHPGSFVAVHLEYLRFATFSFLFLRASFCLACSKQFMLCSLPELSAITTLNVAWSTAGSFTVSCCPLGRTRLWAQSLTCALSTWMPRSPATSPPCTCFYETWPPSIIAHIVLILCWLVMAA